MTESEQTEYLVRLTCAVLSSDIQQGARDTMDSNYWYTADKIAERAVAIADMALGRILQVEGYYDDNTRKT